MGKQFLVAVFIMVLGAACYVFFKRDVSQSQYRPVTKEQTPRVTIEDFTIYKYEDHRVVSSMSGKLGSFYDPSTLEIIGEVRGTEQNKEKNKSFASESLTVHFKAKGLSLLSKDNTIEDAEIENQVRFQYDGATLFTDYARYLQDEEKLSSSLPVRIQSKLMDVMGTKGFDYFSKTNFLQVYGPMEGTLSAIDK